VDVFELQPVVKYGKIYFIEYKIHLSFPKCILSELSVHYSPINGPQKEVLS